MTSTPLSRADLQMRLLLGAPEKDKRHALFDTGHIVWPRPEMIKEIIDWLDRYLGPVNPMKG